MVALDSAARAPSHIRFNLKSVLILGGLLGGLCAVCVPLALDGASYEGWSLAARTTDEFAGLLFLFAFLAAPLAQLFPRSFPSVSGSRRLALSFAAAYGVHLFTTVSLTTVLGEKLDAPQITDVALQFCVLAAMAATSAISSPPRMHHNVWHSIHTATLWFFWLIYTFAYIGHFVGPHIADSSYAAGLGPLIAALFVRYASVLKAVWTRSLAEKVG
jgi:hypothetical protein